MSDSEDENGVGGPPEASLKICLLGNGASGKTSIATILSQNAFNKQYAQTVGLDFFRMRQSLPGGRAVHLQIWDVGGQQIGGALLPTYISGSHGVLFVYDVTNQQSFDDIEDWMKEAKRVLAANPNPEKKPAHFALVGNKTDLQHMLVVKPETHHKFANDNAMSSHLVAASRGDGIHLMIKKITAGIMGVKLDRSDLEEAVAVLPASVVQGNEQGPPRHGQGPPGNPSPTGAPQPPAQAQGTGINAANSGSNSCILQ